VAKTKKDVFGVEIRKAQAERNWRIRGNKSLYEVITPPTSCITLVNKS